MAKALLLLSGGLDSMLAIKVLEAAKVKVTPICFESFFFDCQKAKAASESFGLKLRVVDFSEEHLKMLKSPKHGYGKHMNPCIDCHLLMLKKARVIMEKEGFDFVATGEVLGERPFSQNPQALKIIEKEAGLDGLIIRPLSAKLLKETKPEKEGLVNRDKLYDIQGRSRKPQIALAKKFKIKSFPTPAGGCSLTDPQFAERLKTLFKKIPKFQGKDTELLKKGRLFWEDKVLLVVGRNKKENEELAKLKEKKDVFLEPENFPGPSVLIRGFGKKIKKETIKKATEYLLHYSKKIADTVKIKVDEI